MLHRFRELGLIAAVALLATLLCPAAGAAQRAAPTPKPTADPLRDSATPVYGLAKSGGPRVITVHGFMDNLKMCRQIAGLLNRDESRETLFSCVKLSDGGK